MMGLELSSSDHIVDDLELSGGVIITNELIRRLPFTGDAGSALRNQPDARRATRYGDDDGSTA